MQLHPMRSLHGAPLRRAPLRRNCPSPSRSWSTPPRAAARTASSTPVNVSPAGGARSGQEGLGPRSRWASWAPDRGAAPPPPRPLRGGHAFLPAGRKQDAWFVVDPESGETQMALATESPSTPRLYIGRTRELWAAPLFALPRLGNYCPSRNSPSNCQSADMSLSTERRAGDRAVTWILPS